MYDTFELGRCICPQNPRVPHKVMSRPRPVLSSPPHEAVEALAKILDTEPENISIAQISGAPINQHTRTSFTNSNHFLAPENRVFFCLEYDKTGEPRIGLKNIEDTDLHSPLRRFDPVLLKKPVHGNAPKVWGSLQEFESLNKRIKAATFIRVKKTSFVDGVQDGNSEVVALFYEQNFLHESRGKFLEYTCEIRPECLFKYTFEKRTGGQWITIEDPRTYRTTAGAA